MKTNLITLALLLTPFSACTSNPPSDQKVERENRKDWKAYKVVPAKKVQYKKNTIIRYITIHHTHSLAKSDKHSEDQLLRNVQDGHRFLKWGKDKKYAIKTYNNEPNGTPIPHYGDIAYHYIVGQSGKIYEGRSEKIAGASYTYYLSDSERKGLPYVKGKLQVPDELATKQRPGNIQGHLTVAFLCKDELLPNEAMRNAAVLIAELLIENGLTPKDVRAHRELAQTSCPGDPIYIWLRGSEMIPHGSGVGMYLIKEAYQRLKQ